ncbi:MAG: hypothetical protein KJ824_11455 [Alphaproteobacteria bacterium]|nr:hypothetical protein [Alphaproteobacteria bacterium]
MNVQPERRGGGGGVIAFLVGGLLVVVAIIAFVIYNGGANPVTDAADTSVDVDVNLPSLPDAPTLPEAPNLPPVEPPTLPQPGPAPAN